MKKKHRKFLYAASLLIGLVSIVWEIKIFRNTFINVYLLLGIIVLVAGIAFFLDHKNYGKAYKYAGWRLYIYAGLQYIMSYGFLACSFFMILNYSFAADTVSYERHQIVDRSSISGGKYNRSQRQPTFDIMLNGKEKQLVFPHAFYPNREQYTHVEMEVRKGLFGFDILQNKKLIIQPDN